MKQILISLLGGILFLPACAHSTTATPVIVTQAATATSSPIPTNTNTSIPTATLTASITPLPTIPTFTPTFDARTIVTVTPAPKAECPKENPAVVAKFATPNSDGSYEIYSASDILEYLNTGGTPAQLRDSGSAEIVDLTGDDVNEVVYRGFLGWSYDILGCKNGKYQDFLDFAGDSGIGRDVVDLNKNGVPEIILYDVVHYGFVDISIFEWDGNKFRSLINMGKYSATDDAVIDWVSATWMSDTHYKLIDTNGHGLKEIMVVYDVNQLCGGFGDFCDGTPRRALTTILGWNGQNYVMQQRYYAPAQYKFQAIQDGDDASSQKEYDKALGLYQAAIFSDKLKDYSPEIRDNLRSQFDTRYGTTPTPTPYPIALDEYPKLASYAYYRIVLLHLVQNHESDATTVYNTLQQKFGNDPYGRPYVEMATAFWDAYQSTHKMYDGCAAAIHYAAEHPEILTPLGSDYHGSQSHIYVPADVCPFR
ncbi:MAG TPA: hypothetical protein VK206_12805 [Anaerolineales bacterium]|nr:hypothetical protein [Anaerolineales bacterium]